MGVVFTLVMVVSALMSWFFYNFILMPFDLNFLQIVVFIGLVSLTVQAVDTILRKVNPILFNSFGVYPGSGYCQLCHYCRAADSGK